MTSKPELRTSRYLVLVFVLLSVCVGIAGHLYYKDQERIVKNHQHDELLLTAELKVKQISSWLKERLRDGGAIYNNPLIISGIHLWLTTSSAAELREPLFSWLASLRDDYDYSRAFLFDEQGLMRLSSPSENSHVEKSTQILISEALRTRKVVLSDIYRTEDGKSINMDLVVPLFITRGRHMQSVGGLVLCIDPGKFLFPLIKLWPTSSLTAETLLVRREENDLVFLNEPRHRRDMPLTLRLPVSEKTLPAAMATSGIEGVTEGIDYRGVAVIAAIRAVPDSAWVLVAKIDKDDIYAPIRERFWLIVVIVSALILSAGAATGFIWRYQNALFYRKQCETEKIYRTIFENTGNATCIVQEDTSISLVNSEFEKLSGYSKEEIEGKKSWTEFVAEDDLEKIKKYFHEDITDSNPRSRNFEFRFIDRKGGVKDVLVNAAVISGMKEAVGSLQDITFRKHSEEALRESEERLRFALETSHIGAWDLNLVDHTAFRSLEHDRIFGYADLLPQWTYQMFLEHVLPEDREAVDMKW